MDLDRLEKSVFDKYVRLPRNLKTEVRVLLWQNAT